MEEGTNLSTTAYEGIMRSNGYKLQIEEISVGQQKEMLYGEDGSAVVRIAKGGGLFLTGDLQIQHASARDVL